jgi:hypothetical protein
MRFRRLTFDELQALENELKQFLVVNHVYTEEWAEMNKAQPEIAQKLVDAFSDLVLEKVYSKIEVLVISRPQHLTLLHFENGKAQRIDIQSKGNELCADWNELIQNLMESPTHFDVFYGTKNFNQNHADFVFEFIRQGAEKIDIGVWHDFYKLLANNKK